LIDDVFPLKPLTMKNQSPLEDQARLSLADNDGRWAIRLAFTTDSYVVQPLDFPRRQLLASWRFLRHG